MIKIFSKAQYFFILFFFYLIAGSVILFLFEKGEVELSINRRHFIFWDYFFQGITYLGELAILFIIILIFLFKSIYAGIVSSACVIVSTFTAQILKRGVFEEMVRPKVFFKGIADLYYIEGLEIHSYNSFPSGHTSGAFTIFCFLALIIANKYWQMVFFLLAFLVGISRIYLMQHFFQDTFAGTFIGVLSTVVVFFCFDQFLKLKDIEKLQRPIISGWKQ